MLHHRLVNEFLVNWVDNSHTECVRYMNVPLPHVEEAIIDETNAALLALQTRVIFDFRSRHTGIWERLRKCFPQGEINMDGEADRRRT